MEGKGTEFRGKDERGKDFGVADLFYYEIFNLARMFFPRG